LGYQYLESDSSAQLQVPMRIVAATRPG